MVVADPRQTVPGNSSRPGEDDTKQQQQQQRQPPPQIPPSPTLTNPDMILPCDEGERESSTPSPPFGLPSLSNLQAFYGMRLQNEPGQDSGMGTMQTGATYGRVQKQNFPRRMWTYEDTASRRLSDIGEEEVPSQPRVGQTPGDISVQQGENRPGESPAFYGQMESNAGEAEGWSSSSSTVSGSSELDLVKQQNGYADSYSGNDVNLHGVNEALSTIPTGNGDAPMTKLPNNMIPVSEETGPGDEFSSAILSSEAERILDNAKKRLTLMEGNLTKARSSVRLTPSPVPSPSLGPQPLGLGQPVGGLYRSISRSDRKASAALRPRPTYSSYQDASNNRHSRVHSDLNLSASQSLLPPAEPRISRSVSAMGSTTLGHYQTDERTFRYEPTRAYLTHRASVSSAQGPPVDRGNPPTVKEEDTPPGTPDGLGVSEDGKKAKISSAEEFNSVYPSSGPPSRTQSQLQVRDLQDQMKGLHIKISTLKVRAQEDGLRRRSLQSLRTPSPLASSNNWYDNDMAYKDVRNMNNNNNSNTGRDEPAQDDHTPDEPTQHDHTQHDHNEQSTTKDRHETQDQVAADLEKKEDVKSEATEIDDDSQSVVESLYEDAQDGERNDTDGSESEIDREELNEILNEPLDEDLDETLEAFPPVPGHDSTPHEEREDAFDYEHFILHSALGNYSQTLRRSSNSSTGSVETTRPTYGHPGQLSRSNSVTSQSTMASFATATEGDDLESVLYWDRKFNDELRNHDHYDSDGGDEGPPTPRGGSRQNIHQHTPSSESTGSATPTALVSSLVSTVQAASSPHPGSEKSAMNNDDTRMLEQLFQSLGDVCMDLQALTTQPEPDEKAIRVLRRRLDAARRVLDGELDT